MNLAIVAVLTAIAGPARSADLAAPVDTLGRARPWGVAAGGGAVFVGDREAPGFAAIALDVERVVAPWLTLDVGVASGLSATQASRNGIVRIDPKLVLRAVARPTLVLGRGGRNALFVGLGPSYLAGRAYDGLWYAHTEFGYQFRSWSGFSFLYAIAVDIALNERPPAVSPAGCVTPTCAGPVTPGTIAAGPRVAVGYTF